jgi:hypothetical protein
MEAPTFMGTSSGKLNQILLLNQQSLDLKDLENNGKEDASYQVFVQNHYI